METCKEVAAAWGVFYRTVNNLCKEGTIPGAEKIKVTGQIPDDAKRLADGRISSGKYLKAGAGEKKRRFLWEFQIMYGHSQNTIMSIRRYIREF